MGRLFCMPALWRRLRRRLAMEPAMRRLSRIIAARPRKIRKIERIRNMMMSLRSIEKSLGFRLGKRWLTVAWWWCWVVGMSKLDLEGGNW
ncbi:hypothetical protein Hanom_Chr05g00439301 [Helianthus anomalus]